MGNSLLCIHVYMLLTEVLKVPGEENIQRRESLKLFFLEHKLALACGECLQWVGDCIALLRYKRKPIISTHYK